MTDAFHGFGSQLVQISIVVVICGVLAALAAVLQERRSRSATIAAGSAVLAVGSALAISIATLTRRGDGTGHGRVQLEPLLTLHSYWWTGDPALLLVYVFGNVALFVPLGFFAFLALRRIGWVAVLLAAVASSLCSLTVEVLQLPIWSRSTDIDDWILNSLGGLVGAVLGALAWQGWLVLRRRVERQVLAEAGAATVGAAPSFAANSGELAAAHSRHLT